MNTLENFWEYGDKHHPIWMDFIRIVLGAAFLIKGIQFLVNPLSGLEESTRAFLSIGAMHYIVFAHIVGGLMIMLGLATRIAIIVQLPILVWAIFAAGSTVGVAYAGMAYIAIKLALSLLILFYGSGPLSVDAYWKKHPNS
jgi:putative oxidoreductase